MATAFKSSLSSIGFCPPPNYAHIVHHNGYYHHRKAIVLIVFYIGVPKIYQRLTNVIEGRCL